MERENGYRPDEQEEYEAEQMALPAHKRDGYAERMAEYADFRRKELREQALLDSLKDTK